MASRHHGRCRHYNHRENIPLAAAFAPTSSRGCCSCKSSSCCTLSDDLSPPSLDHLLRLVAAYLEQQLLETQCCDQTQFFETPFRNFNGFKRHSSLHQQKNVQREYDHFVLSCLLRKIEDLESSLDRFSASSGYRHGPYRTVKDSAARVIQTHFRSYLVRRSRSLRQLNELAAIKSNFMSLKSSVSGKANFPFEAVSREAMDLLTRLDSIQGRDYKMIRDGKRSLSRDLVRFIQYVDDCAVKRHESIRKSAERKSFIASSSKHKSIRSKRHDFGTYEDKNTNKLKKMEKIYISSAGDDEDDNVELEESHFVTDDGEDILIVSDDSRKVGNLKSRNGVLVKSNDGSNARVARTMKLNKNGDVYWVHGNTHEPMSSGDDDSIDNELIDSSNTRKGVLVEGMEGKTRVVKSVSFDEKGNVYRFYGDTSDSSSCGDDDNSTNGSNSENGDGKEIGYGEVEEIKCVEKKKKNAEAEKTRSEEEESYSSESSEEGVTLARSISHPGRYEHKREARSRKGGLFSPPSPVKMEP